MGCLPIQITARCKYFNDRKCLQDQNFDSQNYNKKIAKLLPKLQKSLPGSLLLYADTYKPLMDMINNPQKYGKEFSHNFLKLYYCVILDWGLFFGETGFVETNRGCCGTGFVETASLCNIKTPPCGNLSHFLFWDSVHPSQAGYQHVAKYLKKTVLSLLLKHHGLWYIQ